MKGPYLLNIEKLHGGGNSLYQRTFCKVEHPQVLQTTTR